MKNPKIFTKQEIYELFCSEIDKYNIPFPPGRSNEPVANQKSKGNRNAVIKKG